MTAINTAHHLIRPLVITMLASVATPAILSAPSAFAAEKAKPYAGDNTYNRDQKRKMRRAHEQRQNKKSRPSPKVKTSGQRERDWRADRRAGHGDWSNDRERQRRYERALRDQRERTGRTNRRDERTNRRTDRRIDRRVERRDNRVNRRVERRHDRTYRRNNARRHRAHHRDNWRRDRRWERRNDRYWRRQNRRWNGYRPYWNTGWNNYYNGYWTNYRSSLGISFFFGEPGYSRYRWAPSRYSFYQPGYVSYASYQAATYCERVLIEGYHHGHLELISVLECSNPYAGTYIVQGTERIENCYGDTGYNTPYYRR